MNDQRDQHRTVPAETFSPLVSIVVLTYNNIAFVEKCLLCVTAQQYYPLEIIVVDQASRDGTPELIRERFLDVTLISNERNTGFAAGMNRGIEAASGQYVLLLNSDLFLHADYLSRAVPIFSSMTKHQVGMLAGIVYRYGNGVETTEIDSLGSLLLPYHTTVDVDEVRVKRWVLGPSGAAIFLTRSMLDDVRLPNGDYLDSSYFCYGEDIELALRAQLLGWRCLYCPIVVGWHIGSGSAYATKRFNEKPAQLLVHALKNRHLTLLTCYPLSLLLVTLPWNLLAELGQVAAYAIRRDWVSLGCQGKAFRTVWRMLPQALAKRHWVQQRRRVSHAYLRSLFVDWEQTKVFKSLIFKGRESKDSGVADIQCARAGRTEHR